MSAFLHSSDGKYQPSAALRRVRLEKQRWRYLIPCIKHVLHPGLRGGSRVYFRRGSRPDALDANDVITIAIAFHSN